MSDYTLKFPEKEATDAVKKLADGNDRNGLRRIIRACLRELDEERKTIRVVMARLRLQDDEHNYETQAGKDSRVLRSLLPETEGEA